MVLVAVPVLMPETKTINVFPVFGRTWVVLSLQSLDLTHGAAHR